MSIEKFVPAAKVGIDNLSFFFGAGTSYESGYPLISGLTEKVVSALKADDRATLDEVLSAFGKTYDSKSTEPNIEVISDLVTEMHTNSGKSQYSELREQIRFQVSEAILGVIDPNITNQVSFFEGLKRRSYNRPTNIWIFTTNYDLLLEDAATEVGIRLVNGFSGATNRFFSEKEFMLSNGIKRQRSFIEDSCLTIRLIKLHGSISWYRKDGKLFEKHPGKISDDQSRCMVLPRRTKVIDTLTSPYDRLFTISSNSIIGHASKNVVAAGFSFGDDHINDTLITPKLESGSINLTNFCFAEPAALASTRDRPNVTHICSDKIVNAGSETLSESQDWKFSEFVKLI